MNNREKVQAILKGGGKYTVDELSDITGVPIREVSSFAKEMPGVAYKDYEYYLPQDNPAWLLAGCVVLLSFIFVVLS